MREADFQRQVVDLAKLQGWAVWWTKWSLHSPSGWPDLAMCRGERLVFAELKVNADLSKDQRVTLRLLAATGECEVFCWRPSCWPQIERVLAPYRNGDE